jgi:ATP-dependent Clp protease ATP-binding subunit ClpA
LNSWEIDKIKKLAWILKKEIIWQNEAVDSIVSSIMRSKAWITNPNRPLASFLFLWPTGVWKTELVKVLTEKFYSQKDALIKIDMSEFSDKTSVNKLIGSSAGYVGYEEGWYLTEKVRKNPYSVVLFDEIEKWWLEVYNLLLQILEDWILTDNKWRKVNFKNTIIIMTSNIWQEEFTDKAEKIWFDISKDEEEKILDDFCKAKENIISGLSEYFPQEFINRIDKILVFEPLDKNSIKKIVALQLDKLQERLKQKNIKLNYNTRILTWITKEVYNPEFWAREVRRFITDFIEDKIAEKIIMWKIKNNEITLKTEKKELIIE